MAIHTYIHTLPLNHLLPHTPSNPTKLSDGGDSLAVLPRGTFLPIQASSGSLSPERNQWIPLWTLVAPEDESLLKVSPLYHRCVWECGNHWPAAQPHTKPFSCPFPNAASHFLHLHLLSGDNEERFPC